MITRKSIWDPAFDENWAPRTGDTWRPVFDTTDLWGGLVVALGYAACRQDMTPRYSETLVAISHLSDICNRRFDEVPNSALCLIMGALEEVGETESMSELATDVHEEICRRAG